jgi:hypothetical protein
METYSRLTNATDFFNFFSSNVEKPSDRAKNYQCSRTNFITPYMYDTGLTKFVRVAITDFHLHPNNHPDQISMFLFIAEYKASQFVVYYKFHYFQWFHDFFDFTNQTTSNLLV